MLKIVYIHKSIKKMEDVHNPNKHVMYVSLWYIMISLKEECHLSDSFSVLLKNLCSKIRSTKNRKRYKNLKLWLIENWEYINFFKKRTVEETYKIEYVTYCLVITKARHFICNTSMVHDVVNYCTLSHNKRVYVTPTPR